MDSQSSSASEPRMWTFDEIQAFVTSHNVEVDCPVCKTSHSPFRGRLSFVPAMVFYPDFDDAKNQKIARLGVDVMLDHQSCQCSLVESEFTLCRKIAHSTMYNLFAMFLNKKTVVVIPELPPSAASSVEKHRQEVLAGTAY